MIKILQFGEGNFLRTFVDVYFDTLTKEGYGEYGVTIVKPITFGTLERFKKQNNKYHVILRGVADGAYVENVYEINSVKAAIDPFADEQAYYDMAKDAELKIIVSNTTEAGICFNEKDEFEGFEHSTYPAKLTKFLYERFKAGLDGVYLMPVELIDNNADELYKCVDKYVTLWNLPKAFKKWNDERNYYCNTLVDRIVSGYPRDEETEKHLESLIGEKDELMSVGEPFGLWAVEKKGNIAEYIQEGVHNIEVVLTKDIGYYKKRKVRVLNGSHTNLVPVGLMLGAETVYDCMKDEKLSAFVEDTLREEINPLVGKITDRTVALGGSAILTEVPEMFGAEQLLMNKCRSEEVFEKYKTMIENFKAYYTKQDFPVYENPSPGNKKGGITTLEEKSLGCIEKAGTSEIVDVLAYGELVKTQGVSALNAPGNDLIAATALAASGCQIVLFTTGRGTPFSTFVPTMKISSNTRLAKHKAGWIDFNAYDMDEEGLFDLLLKTVNGEYKCASEDVREMAFYKTGVTL